MAKRPGRKLEIIKTAKDTLGILRNNPLLFVPIAAYIGIVLASEYLVPSTDVLASGLSAIVNTLAAVFFSGVLIRMSHDAMKKNKISIAASSKSVAKVFVRVLLSEALLTAIIALSISPTLLLAYAPITWDATTRALAVIDVVVTIYVSSRMIFNNYAILIDNDGVLESLKTSWKMTNGHVLRIWGILFVAFAMIIAASVVAGVLLGIVFYPDVPSEANHVIGMILSIMIVMFIQSELVIAYRKLR